VYQDETVVICKRPFCILPRFFNKIFQTVFICRLVAEKITNILPESESQIGIITAITEFSTGPLGAAPPRFLLHDFSGLLS
jgi:hypothetical protein